MGSGWVGEKTSPPSTRPEVGVEGNFPKWLFCLLGLFKHCPSCLHLWDAGLLLWHEQDDSVLEVKVEWCTKARRLSGAEDPMGTMTQTLTLGCRLRPGHSGPGVNSTDGHGNAASGSIKGLVRVWSGKSFWRISGSRCILKDG